MRKISAFFNQFNPFQSKSDVHGLSYVNAEGKNLKFEPKKGDALPHFASLTGEQVTSILQSIDLLPKDVQRLTSPSKVSQVQAQLKEDGQVDIRFHPKVVDFMQSAMLNAQYTSDTNRFASYSGVELALSTPIIKSLQKIGESFFKESLKTRNSIYS